jgi:hypothetical protein
LLGLFLALCYSRTCQAAETVYDNGPGERPPPPNHVHSYEMTGWIVADDFTLFTSARIEGVQFLELEGAGIFQGTILWRIYANSANEEPGVLLYSGTATNVNHSLTGFVDPPLVEFADTFAIGPISLPPGIYWLALHNGPLSNGSNQRVYWERASTSGFRGSESDIGCGSVPCQNPAFADDWGSNNAGSAPTSELVFQLTGFFAPSVTAVSRSNGTPQISFTTTAGQSYRLEFKNNLTDPTWTTVPGADMISGNGNPVQVSDMDPNAPTVPHRFYRAVLL